MSQEKKLQHKIIPVNTAADWENLTEHCPYLTDWGKNILKAGLQSKAKSVLVERDYVCKDHTNLFSNFYSKRYDETDRKTYRLHFFSDGYSDFKEWLNSRHAAIQNAYLGFSVIRKSAERCLGRSIFDPVKIGLASNNYILTAGFTATVFGRKMHINGFPYMSQDIDITVCAHSALWAVCRYLSEKFRAYKEYLPFDIVELADKSNGRIYPYRGMTYMDYSQIMTQFGVFPLVEKMNSNDGYEVSKNERLYTYVESGFPVIASYGGHVAVIVGHTLKEKITFKSGQKFTSTADLIGDYIVVDDNYFPYRKLNETETSGSTPTVQTFIVPLPEKIFLTAEIILTKVNEYIEIPDFYNKLTEDRKGPYLKRVFIATSISYKRRLLEHFEKNHDIASYLLLNMPLPHFIWVVELMTEASYEAREADCVILLDPTAEPKKEFDGMILFQKMSDQITVLGRKPDINLTSEKNKKLPMFVHNLAPKEMFDRRHVYG